MSFFVLRIRRPPRSTLFPYTTSSDLRRRGAALRLADARSGRRAVPAPPCVHQRQRHHRIRRPFDARDRQQRSEEHTSELQSHSDLVCRLLLEKKKASLFPAPFSGLTV